MKLYIGNKNYSSWSLRAWVLMTQAGLTFEEVPLRFDGFGPESAFKQAIGRISPAGQVPVLVDGDITVWDTLAIAEYLHERFPQARLWPADVARRARARSVTAEMHAGFRALRGHCGMNIEASLPEVGAHLFEAHAELRADLRRLDTLWADAVTRSDGPMLFGEFSIADAFFAPVAFRVRTYGLPLGDVAAGYAARLLALPAMQAWERLALAEQDFLPFEEDYRSAR